MASEMTTEKMIAIILAILVIIAIVIAIIKPDLLNWIRGLPEYKYSYEDEKIISGEGELASSVSCEVLVAQIGDKPLASSVSEAGADLRNFYAYLENKKYYDTGMYYKVWRSGQKELIILPENWLKKFLRGVDLEWFVTKVGYAAVDKLIIYPDAYRNNLILSKIRYEDLRKIDGAVFADDFHLCRTKQEMAVKYQTLIAKVDNGVVSYLFNNEYVNANLLIEGNKVLIDRTFPIPNIEIGSIKDNVISIPNIDKWRNSLPKDIRDFALENLNNAVYKNGIIYKNE